MNPIHRALWLVEAHLQDPVTLDGLADQCGVSPFHLTRAFSAVTGRSLMRYVRSRRLSEAARRLVRGEPGILDVALDAGYGSHEAFTRAFRTHFGITPERLRGAGSLDGIKLTEPIAMNETPSTELVEPRFETRGPLLMAGIVERYDDEGRGGIPQQWQRFQPYLAELAGPGAAVAWGICYNTDDDGNFDYMCGLEVPDFSDLPKALSSLRIPALTYAVFRQEAHVASIRQTFAAIFGIWMPAAGYEAEDGPMLERYGTEFDPVTGNGGFEVWIPVRRA